METFRRCVLDAKGIASRYICSSKEGLRDRKICSVRSVGFVVVQKVDSILVYFCRLFSAGRSCVRKRACSKVLE